MNEITESMQTFIVDRLPGVAIPIAILVVGWLVALILGAAVRAALRRTGLDDRITAAIVGDQRATKIDSARWAGRLTYYVVLLFVAVAFLQAIQLTSATEPINALLGSVLEFLPRLVGAAAILLVAWVLAAVARRIIAAALAKWGVDRRVSRELEDEVPIETEAPEQPPVAVERTIAESAYWLVFLLFVPAVLDTLGIEGLLAPVQTMFDKVLAFLPNLASAALIGIAGWLFAHALRRIVTNLLAGTGLDRLAERITVSKALGKNALSTVIGLLVYILVLLPVVVGALNALQLEAITRPASRMLQSFFDALPALFGAGLVVGVAYFAGKLLSGFVSQLLQSIGFDTILSRIGLAEAPLGKRSPSSIAGALVMIAVMFFGVIEGAQLLGFEEVSAFASDIAALGGRILLGLLIFGMGLYFARLAAEGINNSGVQQSKTLALVARGSVIALAAAMALRQMAIADEIIELAFGLGLGAFAVAGAIAFGLGGREAAASIIEGARSRLRLEAKPRPEHPRSAAG